MATAENGPKDMNGKHSSKDNGKRRCCGCGYPTPMDAMKHGPREKIMYVTCVRPPRMYAKNPKPDYLSVVDLDPESDTYCQVINTVELTSTAGDELHHFGWNACSSCYGQEGVSRSKLVLLSLMSSRVYVVDVSKDEKAPTLHKVIEPEDIIQKTGNCNPHTTHCLPSREVMISTLGDNNGNAKGSFVLLDSESFEVVGRWEKDGETAPFGYGFWYQPFHNVMISSEWGAPRAFSTGFNPMHLKEGQYGRTLHVWDWENRTRVQNIDLGPDGMLPFEVRFLHDPKESQGYVGCSYSSSIFRFFKKEDGDWDVEKVISVASMRVKGWILSDMPGLLTDNLISLDDKYMYMTLYLHGDVRQYDISDRSHPKLVGRIVLGGCFHKGTDVYPQDDPYLLEERPDQVFIKGKPFLGGPHKCQLSLDGKRLYVTNSLFTRWDEQFYPEVIEKGSMCVKLNVDTEKGGLTLDPDFLVEFVDEDGPSLAHEMRYPGGDCTSDVWLAVD